MLELISVHVPKCAGTAFFTALERTYGADAIYHDFLDRPTDPASHFNMDPDGYFERSPQAVAPHLENKRVVHGHFHVHKYRHITHPCLRITFLRHPVERLISHYFYWLKLPRFGHNLHDYFLDQRLTLPQFARLPLIRRIYCDVFFRDVDLKIFDFIGAAERSDADLERLSRLLGRNLKPDPANVNSEPAYHDARQQILNDRSLIGQLTDLLSDDIELYWRAVG
jgi:hypothetical protein